MELPRGIVPEGCKHLTAAMDLGKHLNHWVLVAWTDGPFAHVVDYGRIEVPSDDFGIEAAIMVALRQFRDLANVDWPSGGVPAGFPVDRRDHCAQMGSCIHSLFCSKASSPD